MTTYLNLALTEILHWLDIEQTLRTHKPSPRGDNKISKWWQN